MLYAKEGLEPTKGATSTCPGCGAAVVAKCGRVNVHHWSHKSSADCDSWYEPESHWHKGWKEKYPKECREVVIGDHRADIFLKGKGVIELQHSSLSVEKIEEREAFYGDMIWIVNGEDFKRRFYYSENKYGHTFTWEYPRKRWAYANKPLFIDLGDDGLFQITKFRLDGRGYGKLWKLKKTT